MKYYIGSINGSGIEANTFEDFIEYLKDMAITAEEQGEDWFEVNVETYLTGSEDQDVTVKRYRIYNIQWDADGEDMDHLPTHLTSEIEFYNDVNYSDNEITEMISDDITDRIGFCHFGFEYEEIKEEETK